MGRTSLPTLNEGSIAIQMIRPVSVGISHSVALDRKSQDVIKSIPEVTHVFSRIGTAEVSMDPMGPNISDCFVFLKPNLKRSKAEVIDHIVRELTAKVPGQRILVSQPIQLRFNELMEGTRSDVSLKVFGDDQAMLTEEAEKIATIIKKIDGAGDVELEAKGKMTVLDIKPKYNVLRELGVSASEVLETIGIAVGGLEVGSFYEGMKKFPIVIRIDDTSRNNLSLLKELPVGLNGGSTVPLHKVAEIKFEQKY